MNKTTSKIITSSSANKENREENNVGVIQKDRLLSLLQQ